MTACLNSEPNTMSKWHIHISKIVIALWRSFNAIILVIGFSGPWFGIFGDLANGFVATRFLVTDYLGIGIREYVDLFTKPGPFWLGIFFILIAIGLISTWVYWIVNLLRIFIGHNWKIVWSALPLAVGDIGLMALTIYLAKYAYGGLNRCYWAFWLVLWILGSSTILEIVSYKLNHMANKLPSLQGCYS